MDGRTYVHTYVRTVDDVMAIKTRFLSSMGYHIFLTMVLRACKGGPLINNTSNNLWFRISLTPSSLLNSADH